MADKKITQLTQHTTVIDNDLLAVVDVTGNETKKLTVGSLKNHTNSGLVLSSSISGSPTYVAYYDTDGNLSNSSIQFSNSGSANNVNYVSFNTTYDHIHREGDIHWNDELKTLTLDTDVLGFDLEVGKKLAQRVKNSTGATIEKGKVVYINGGDGAWPTVTTASWEGDPTSAATLGIMGTTTLNNQYGYAVETGIIRNIDTSNYTAGQVFYLHATGSWTGSVPQSPKHEVRLGHIIRVHPESGSAYVRIQNGYEFSELHDVENYDYNTLPDGHHIEWDATTKIWRPKPSGFSTGELRLFVAAARSNTNPFYFNSQTRTSDTSASPVSDSGFLLTSGDLSKITVHLRSSTSVSAVIDISKNANGTAFSTATSIVTPITQSLTADTVTSYTFTGLALDQFDAIHIGCTPGGAGDFYGIVEIT